MNANPGHEATMALTALTDLLSEVQRALKALSSEVTRLREEMAARPPEAGRLTPPFAPPTAREQLVTLDQCAAMVGVRKRSLARHRAKMPPPVVPGRRGRAALYSWDEVRPWLEREYGRRLPERFPGPAG